MNDTGHKDIKYSDTRLKKQHNYQHKTTIKGGHKNIKNITNDTRHHKEQHNY